MQYDSLETAKLALLVAMAKKNGKKKKTHLSIAEGIKIFRNFAV